MIDDLLLPLAKEAIACYDDTPSFVWEGEGKTSHLRHTIVNDIHTFTFAGTMPTIREWFLDVFAFPVPVMDICQIGDVHAGFAVGAVGAVFEYILPKLAELGYPKFMIAGHSKGAGQAGLAHGILKSLGHSPTATRLFEPPLFGGHLLADLMSSDDVEWTQTYNTYRTDLVTHLPIGPTWKRHKPPIMLPIQDTLDLIDAHKMPAVLDALQRLNTTT